MHRWLRRSANRLALDARVRSEELRLTGEEIDLLLDEAARAARESGARTNAPLYCYLLGRASALSGRSLGDLVSGESPLPAGSAVGDGSRLRRSRPAAGE